MFRALSKLAAWRGNLARLALAGVVGVVLFGAATPAPGELLSTDPALGIVYTNADGTWKLRFQPDAAAKSAGRTEFLEYVTVDGYGYTGMEISRLGFNPTAPSTGTNILGEVTFTVNISSASHGTWKADGKFDLTFTAVGGTMTWTEGANVYKYTFTGERHTPTSAEHES